jgi:threonine/homoserine/homoserine lactone efflux protein
MRAAMPFILVALALFTAACIAYIAWELSSGKTGKTGKTGKSGDEE